MIVSITSFPARIPHIAPCLASIVSQIETGDRVVLWLGSDRFPRGIEDVPDEIRAFSSNAERSVEIRFTEDIRAYTKLIPSLVAFPGETIITMDDDVVYAPRTIELLKKAHDKNPTAVFAHAVSDLYRSHGQWRRTSGTYGFFSTPQPLQMMLGIGAVLYPPDCLDVRVTDRSLFQSLCPTNDDVWFWYCAAKRETPILRVPGAIRRPRMLPAASLGALSATNESNGDQVNREYIRRICVQDPEFAHRMNDVYARHRPWIACARLLRILVHYPRQVFYCLARGGGLAFLKSEIRRALG